MRVLVRVRPPLQPGGGTPCVELLPRDGAVRLRHGGARRSYGESPGALRADFAFSCALGARATQEDVWESVRGPIDRALHEGTNACVLAYGQTGSGKTHTIYGPTGSDVRGGAASEQRGLLPRTLEYVFAQMRAAEAASDGKIKFTATASFLEVSWSPLCTRESAQSPCAEKHFSTRAHVCDRSIYSCQTIFDTRSPRGSLTSALSPPSLPDLQ